MEYVKITSKHYNYGVEVEKNYYEKNWWMLRNYIYECFEKYGEFPIPFADEIENSMELDPEEFLDIVTKQVEELVYFRFGAEFLMNMRSTIQEDLHKGDYEIYDYE